LHSQTFRVNILCRAESPAWFAAAAYNAGLAALHAKDSTAAAVLFRASGSFHEAFVAPSAQNLVTQMVRHLIYPLQKEQ